MNEDVLTEALHYALDRLGGASAPVAVLNACGLEDKASVRQSHHAGINALNTLSGAFETVLVRATRQSEETLGLVAMAMGVVAQGGRIVIAQENDYGAASLEKALRAAFPALTTVIKYKCRVMALAAADARLQIVEQWRESAAMRRVEQTGLWSMPGLFSWNRLDPGSRLLLSSLPHRLEGRGADLGCGYGYLSVALANKAGISDLYAIDDDSRAIEACRRNLGDAAPDFAVHVLWRDATRLQGDLPPLDWVVTNPPFHTRQGEDRALGQAFCRAAVSLLRPGGVVYIVANRHMPYEALLEKAARKVTVIADAEGYKVFEVRV